MSDTLADVAKQEPKEDRWAKARMARNRKSRTAMAPDLPPAIISPDGVYAPFTLAKLLGCPELTIRRHIARKRLKACRVAANRHLVLGRWVFEWMEDDWRRRQQPRAA